MKLTLKHNLAEFKRQVEAKAKQVEFAQVVAATRTAAAIQRRTPDFLDRQLDRPSPFTKRGLYVTRATRADPVAVVGFKDTQAGYLIYQEEGGKRSPSRSVIVLPSQVALNAYGNVPPAQLRRLYERAKNDKRATKALGRKLGVSSRTDLFVGDPGEGFPPGIFKRTTNGLIPIVVFREQAVSYRPRLGWRAWAKKQAAEVYPVEFRRALSEALASAR